MSIPAIEQHYLKNRQRLVKKMTFRAGSPQNAEDIIQESYYRALKYYNSFNGEDFNKWFSTILNNCLREFKNIEKGYSLDEFNEEDAERIHCTFYPSQIWVQVFQRIHQKSPDQREVLILFFKYEYSARDISHITDFTYAKIHQIIQRFRNELKEIYQ